MTKKEIREILVGSIKDGYIKFKDEATKDAYLETIKKEGVDTFWETLDWESTLDEEALEALQDEWEGA